MQTNIMIAGSGGQGILFLGRLICQAAMNEGKNVTWFPSYGAEMRGGTANCTVAVSSEIIGSPIIKYPDIMIILNSESFKKFLPRIRKEGELYFDSTLISDDSHRDDISVHSIPSSEIAGTLGNPRLSNMVLLGAFTACNGLVSDDSVRKAVEITVPAYRKHLITKNLSAFEKGSDFAKNQKSKS